MGMAALVLLTLPACGSSDDPGPRANPSTSTSPSASATPTPSASDAAPTVVGRDSGAPDIPVGMQAHVFVPTTLAAGAGRAYDLKADNPSRNPHSFTITSLKIDVEIPRRSITFAALPKLAPGTLEFFCKYHSDMKGTLTVA
jgi:plastocyanin